MENQPGNCAVDNRMVKTQDQFGLLAAIMANLPTLQQRARVVKNSIQRGFGHCLPTICVLALRPDQGNRRYRIEPLENRFRSATIPERSSGWRLCNSPRASCSTAVSGRSETCKTQTTHSGSLAFEMVNACSMVLSGRILLWFCGMSFARFYLGWRNGG